MSQTLSLSKVLSSQPGWYRGDLHAHTNFSDGHYPPAQLADVARSEGLDFLAITDHNTVDSFPEFGSQPDVLIIPGLEVTFDEGHFNIFGIQGWSAWMEHICTGQNRIKLGGEYDTVTRVMKQTSAEGLLNSINHPLLEPWAWLENETELQHLHCLEIWNDPSFPTNRQANPQTVALWSAWLNAGYRITAIGGSDYHRPVPDPGDNMPPQRLGLPSTYVYAEELSGAAILTGLRYSRVYVSMGPRLTFQARANGAAYHIGADLGTLNGEISFTATVSDCPVTACAQIVKNGQAIAAALVEGNSAASSLLRAQDEVDPTQPAWYRLDVFDYYGQMLAITNPIYTGLWRGPGLQSYGDFPHHFAVKERDGCLTDSAVNSSQIR